MHGRSAPPGRGRRPERHREVDPLEAARRARPARLGHRHPHATGRDGRLPAPGARAASGRDRARVPVAPHRGRRRGARTRRRVASLWPVRRRGRTTCTRTRSSDTSRSVRPTSTRASARSATTSGSRNGCSTSRCPRCRAGRRHARNLAAIVLARFDVFLLDEPTNDLDFAGLERLERFLRERADGRRGDRVARPRVPRSHDHVGARDRRALALGDRVRRRLAVLPRRAVDGPAPRRGGVRRLPGAARRAARPCPTPARMVGAGQGQGEEVGRDRQAHPRVQAEQQRARRGQGQDHRSCARPPRGERGREALGGLGPAHGDRDRAAQRHGRRPAGGRGRAPRVVHARPDRPADRVRRTRRDRRRERRRQDDPARHARRPAPDRRRRPVARAGRDRGRARPGPRRVLRRASR